MIPSLCYVKGLLIIEIAQLLISGDFVEINMLDVWRNLNITMHLQSVTKYFTKTKKIKQNWTRPEKINFWREDWARACVFIRFRDFLFLS